MNLSLFQGPRWRALVFGSVLALGGAWALSAQAGIHGGGPGGAMTMESPRHLDRMVDRMLDRAQASDAQRAQVRQIVDVAAADLKPQREAQRALRQEQMRLFAQPQVDATAVEQLRRKQLAQHDQLSQRMTQAMLDISRVLTPEQRAKLAERMASKGESMHQGHGACQGHEGRDGHGPHHGHESSL